jgi:hypothetical protein
VDGLLVLVVEMVTLRTISGWDESETASRRSAPPFSASVSCAPVICTVPVVQSSVPGLLTAGPFWYALPGASYCTR